MFLIFCFSLDNITIDTVFYTLIFCCPQAVRVAIFYSNPQRLDVYVNNNLIGPTNAQWRADKSDYTLREPTYTGRVQHDNSC